MTSDRRELLNEILRTPQRSDQGIMPKTAAEALGIGQDPEPGGSVTGLIGPWGIPPMTAEQVREDHERYEADQARGWRQEAVKLAVRALTPIAGAYRDTKDYADHIVDLADRLGDYIQNGLEA